MNVISEKHVFILHKAEELFAKKGFDATTVRDIAKAAHINLAMISYYFGSKDKLLEKLFAYRMSIITEDLQRLFENQSLSPLQKLQTFVEEYIARVFRKQDFYKIVLCEQIINNNPKVIELMQEWRMKNLKLVELIVKQGQDQEVFSTDVDVHLLLNSIVGTVIQTVINKGVYKEPGKNIKSADKAFDDNLKQKLLVYLNNLLKAILVYEK